jgi:hypothetical protein
MKIYHFALLFLIFFAAVVIKTDVKIGKMEDMAAEKVAMIESLYTASSDAIDDLAAAGNYGSNTIEKDEVINTFYSSLYANLGIISDKNAQAEIEMYIPVILLCDSDGYYVYYYNDYKDNDGKTYTKRIWSEKMPYPYRDDCFNYCFSLTDKVSIHDVNELLPDTIQNVFEMDYHEFQTEEIYEEFRDNNRNCILLNDELYELTRKQTILNQLEEVLSYYTNKHNYIARQNGITYNFAFPPGSEEEWAQYLDDVSMVVVFQGYPYGADKNYTFNKVASAGANIIKKSFYYVEEKSWYKLAHKAGCPSLINNTMVMEETFDSIEECAKIGAYSDDCIEHGPRAPEIR